MDARFTTTRTRWVKRREFKSKVAGVTWPNPNGTSRQAILQRCRIGMAVTLKREPRNAHDENAIAVFSPKGQIGYIASEVAAKMSPEIDAGSKQLRARIVKVGSFYGGDDDDDDDDDDDVELVWFAELSISVCEPEEYQAFSFARFAWHGSVAAVSSVVSACRWIGPRLWERGVPIARSTVAIADGWLSRLSGGDRTLLWVWVFRVVAVLFMVALVWLGIQAVV